MTYTLSIVSELSDDASPGPRIIALQRDVADQLNSMGERFDEWLSAILKRGLPVALWAG